jgi:hypothetical protein
MNVSFELKTGEKKIGKILKINPKTAKVDIGNSVYTVSYGLLSVL